jgi:hypothetical protein
MVVRPAERKCSPAVVSRQLLTLTSGLAPSEHPIRAPSWKVIVDKPMSSQPGERFAYGPNQLNTLAYALGSSGILVADRIAGG